MSNGFSSKSSLPISRSALRGPRTAGAKVTLKVVPWPGASALVPGGSQVNSAAAGPDRLKPPRLSTPLPVFVMTKIFVVLLPILTLPKPTLASPSTRLVPAGCCTAISGAEAQQTRSLIAILSTYQPKLLTFVEAPRSQRS